MNGIETVYQNLALADDLDVTANIFLGREIEFFRLGPLSWLNKSAMKKKSSELLSQTGIKIGNLNQAVASMSGGCLLYTSPSPRDRTRSRMPSSA